MDLSSMKRLCCCFWKREGGCFSEVPESVPTFVRTCVRWNCAGVPPRYQRVGSRKPPILCRVHHLLESSVIISCCPTLPVVVRKPSLRQGLPGYLLVTGSIGLDWQRWNAYRRLVLAACQACFPSNNQSFRRRSICKAWTIPCCFCWLQLFEVCIKVFVDGLSTARCSV